MPHFKKSNIQYHRNYSTLKARGVGGDHDKDYILTVHKFNVRVSGYEYYNEFELEKRRIARINASLARKENEDTQRERFANSVVRSRSTVVQLGANNPWEYFVTLTFNPGNPNLDVFDLASIKKKLLEFFSDYARRSGAKTGFKYLLIPEKHKSGAWHFHGLLMGFNPKDLFLNEHGYLDFGPFRRRFGWVSFGRTKKDNDLSLGDGLTAGKIRDLRRTASYITKYITKDMLGSDGHNSSEHLFFASKGLKRDEVLAVGEARQGIQEFKDSGYEVHENEFCAKIMVEDRETGLTFIRSWYETDDPWHVTAGQRDRFSVPAMPLNISKEQRKALRKRQNDEMDDHVEFRAKNPLFTVSSVSAREAEELAAMFARAALRNGKYEQLKLHEMSS